MLRLLRHGYFLFFLKGNFGAGNFGSIGRKVIVLGIAGNYLNVQALLFL